MRAKILKFHGKMPGEMKWKGAPLGVDLRGALKFHKILICSTIFLYSRFFKFSFHVSTHFYMLRLGAPFSQPFLFPFARWSLRNSMFYISESISYYYILFVYTCSRFFYPLVAPYSFLFHFVEHLGAPFLSSYFLSLPLFFKVFPLSPLGRHSYSLSFSLFFCICFFFFPLPSLSFLFFFAPPLLRPLFFLFFSLFSFLFSFAPLLFGAPLRPPGGTCPLCPQDTPLKTFQLLVTASWKKGSQFVAIFRSHDFVGAP